MDILRWLFDAQIHVGNQSLLVREVLGNAFGLASALGGMQRKVWAWPVGILGNLLGGVRVVAGDGLVDDPAQHVRGVRPLGKGSGVLGRADAQV